MKTIIVNTIALALFIAVIIALVSGNAEKANMQNSAAIKDSGRSTHPHKVIEQKQIKDTYNYDSLRGE